MHGGELGERDEEDGVEVVRGTEAMRFAEARIHGRHLPQLRVAVGAAASPVGTHENLERSGQADLRQRHP